MTTEKHIIFTKDLYKSYLGSDVRKIYYIYKRLIQLLIGLLMKEKHIIFTKDLYKSYLGSDDRKTYYIYKRLIQVLFGF